MTYDKAKWHLEGDFPADLDEHQAYVTGGLLFAWMAKHQLLSEECESEFSEVLTELRAGRMTGPEAYDAIGGVLAEDLFTAKANRFLGEYMDVDTGTYLDDYAELIGDELPSDYHVPDTKESYEKLAPLVDRRFAEWSGISSPT